MIDLDAVRDRIREIQDLSFVGDAVDAADAIENMVAPTPCAYVSVARESGSPNKNSTGRHTQVITADISVLFALASQRAAADLKDKVEATRSAITDQMIGWTPSGGELPFDFVSYSVRFMGQGMFWGEILFRSKYLRQMPTG